MPHWSSELLVKSQPHYNLSKMAEGERVASVGVDHGLPVHLHSESLDDRLRLNRSVHRVPYTSASQYAFNIRMSEVDLPDPVLPEMSVVM
eukprot:COSAG05_NODE_1413_length_4954_cov_15.272091_1_plen_90_part_00